MSLDRNLRFLSLVDATVTASRDSTLNTNLATSGSPIWSTSYLSYLGHFGNNCAVMRGKIALTQAIKQTTQSLSLTQVSVSGTTVTYTGTITGGGASAFAGWAFRFSGFTNFGNNVTAIVTSSTATTLVCTLISQVNETHAGTAAADSTVTSYLISGAAYGNGVSGFQVGAKFYISDFATNAGNNTTASTGAGFVCVASDITAIALTNNSGVNETNTASAWPVMSNPSTNSTNQTNSQTTFGLTQAIKQTAFSRAITAVTFSTVSITITMATDGSGANAYQNWMIQISGLANSTNNGFFMCTSSTSTTLVLNNANGIAEASPPGGSLAVSASTSTSYVGTSGGSSTTDAWYGAMADCVLTVANFPTNAGNNGTFKVVASSGASFGVTNNSGVNETPASNRRGIATMNAGMSWAFNQTGYTNTNDSGQVVWNTVSFMGQVTNADGTIGGSVVRYTLSVTPLGIRVGQVFTVTGTTSQTFDLSGVITAINTGSKLVDITMNSAPSNTSQSGLTANGYVLAGTQGPSLSPASTTSLYDVANTAANSGTSHTHPTKFRGVWSPTLTYQALSTGLNRNNIIYPMYAFHDVIWNTSADPNYYLCVARPTWRIISVTGNNTTITYTTGEAGAPGTQPLAGLNNLVINEYVTVTGCTTSTCNVVNAKVTAVGTNTFTVTVAGFNTSENEVANSAMVNVMPGVTGNATTDAQSSTLATQTHWVPYHYEIFQSNDGATTYYMKVEYSQGAAASPVMSFTFGTASDGTGNLTGQTYREPMGSNAGQANTALSEFCFWGAGSGANIVLFGARRGGSTTTQAEYFLAVERSKNTSGTDTSDYITYVMGWGVISTGLSWKQNSLILAALPYRNLSTRQVLFYTGQVDAKSAVVTQGVFSIGISASLGSWRDGTAGSANVAVAPVFPNVGCFDNPMTLIAGMSKIASSTTDFVDNTTLTMTQYGSTRTMLMTDGGGNTSGVHTWPSTTATSHGCIAIRWEA